jgi:hypothetical protein
MLFTPKKGSEMRRMLKGHRRQAALPSPEAAAPTVTPEAVTEPVDLDARIEETRRQVEEELSQPYADTEAVITEEPETPSMVDEPAMTEPAVEVVEEVIEQPEPEVVDAEAEMTSIADDITVLPVEPEVEDVPPPIAPEETTTEAGEDDAWDTDEEDSWTAPAADTATDQEPIIIDDGSTEDEDSGFYQVETEMVPEEPVELQEPVEEPVPEVAAVEPEVTTDAAEENEIDYLSTPAAGEPEIDEPAAVVPETETEPTQQETSKADFDREAMRRRIEETRARLKAKAFDAMVQGESFISTEAEADGTGDAVDLDAEAEDAIEQSLREED